jgi:hypothetical protein
MSVHTFEFKSSLSAATIEKAQSAIDGVAVGLDVGDRTSITVMMTKVYEMSALEFAFRDRINVSVGNEPRPFDIKHDAPKAFCVSSDFYFLQHEMFRHLFLHRYGEFSIAKPFYPGPIEELASRKFKIDKASYKFECKRFTSLDELDGYEVLPYEPLRTGKKLRPGQVDSIVYLAVTPKMTVTLERLS